MKKILLCILLALVSFPVAGIGFQWTFKMEEIPMMVVAVDYATNAPYYSFYNIANFGFYIDMTDNISLKMRLKDTYFALTNQTITADRQNRLYIDRLSFLYRSDVFGVLAGRDMFVENNGLLLGNLADGLRLNGNLLEFKQRLYVTHSSLFGNLPVLGLPNEVNQFKVTQEDYNLTNGASRLSVALALEKLGFLTKSLSVMYMHSFDLSTNQKFNPGYVALMSDGPIVGNLGYNCTAAYQLGSLSNGHTLSAWAGDFTLVYYVPGENKWGLNLEVAAASGDNADTAAVSEGFTTFGRFNTGFVLSPLFSNLLMVQFGGFIKGLNDTLSLKADYAYLMRLNTNDTVNGLYDGDGLAIGHEVSVRLGWDFDPNLGLFLQAGYLVTGDAIESRTNDFKVIGGMKLSI